MNKVKSLKQRVSEISVFAFLGIVVLMFTCFTLYSIKKTKVTEENIQADLTLNLKNQVALFLPSYLLPEQRQGVVLLLEKIKKNENLEDLTGVSLVKFLIRTKISLSREELFFPTILIIQKS